MMFYLKQPVSLNLDKFEKNTPTEETLTYKTLSIHTFSKLNTKSEYLIGRSCLFKFNLHRPLKQHKKAKKWSFFKLLFLSYIPSTLYYFHTNSIAMLYLVHKYKKKFESTNMDLTHSKIMIFF